MKETQEQKQNTSISDDIIHSYKLLHKYFFKYSIFFITTIIGIFIFRGILKSNATNIQINQENFEFTLKQRALILNFNKQMSQSIDDENMHIDIIQGFVDNEGDYIESMNNLGSYKGYILPKFFSIYKTLPLQDISYFAQETYNSKELDTFIQNILLAKRENNEKQNANIQLPLKETLVETFDLGCVQQQKIYQKICNIHIENFLDSFFVYALRQDYEGLKEIFDEIIETEEHRGKLCEGMEKYIIYANDTTATIEELFSKCDSQSFENFKKLSAFLEIQNQLDSKQITKTAYSNNDINAYKILSVQQMIYRDMINNRSNLNNILEYLEFVQELLKSDRIDDFYKDLTYRFNNKYIVPWVDNQNNPIIKNKKPEVDNIKKQITIIDNGDDLLGFEGLLYQLTNNNLIPSQSITQEQNTEEAQQKKIEALLANINYLKIKDQIFSGNNIFINGDFMVTTTSQKTHKAEEKKIAAIFKLNYTRNTFFVEQIKILEQSRLNAVIKELLKERTYSLNEIFEYIQQNLPFYDENILTDTSNLFCEQLEEKLVTNNNIQINNCEEGTINISKRKSNEISINYQIDFDEYQITNIVISDKDIQSEINKKISEIQTNEFNFIEIVSSIIYYIPEGEGINEGSENILIITEKIKNYLGIYIDDIAEKDGKILIEFSVGGIKFIGNYSMNNHIIYPIYFKEVLLNDVPAKIINFSLSLDDENKTHIYKFISDPLEEIKTISPQSYMLYQEFISQTP